MRYVRWVAFVATVMSCLWWAPAPASAEGPKKSSEQAEDPRLKLARLSKEAVEQQEKDLATIQEEIVRAIEGMGPGKLEPEKLAVDGLKKLVGQLRGMAKELVEKHSRYVESTTSLKRAMEDSAPAFREASKLFRRYADEETYKDLQQDYIYLGQAWADMARVMEKRAKELDAEPKEVEATVQYLRRTALFLDRFAQHLDSFPDLSTGAERQRFLDQLRNYIQGFESLRSLFRQFHGNLKAQALTPELHHFRVTGVKYNNGSLQATAKDGFSVGQQVAFYRPGVGHAGRVQVVACRSGGYAVRALAGCELREGDIILRNEKDARPAAVAKDARPPAVAFVSR